MPKIIKNGKEYSGVPVEVVTAWAPTADPVQVKEPLMGNTDISSIGDGTVTGAIDAVNNGLIKFKNVTVSCNFNGSTRCNIANTALGVDIDKIYAAWAYSAGAEPFWCASVKGANLLQINSTSTVAGTVSVTLNILYRN